ncbi:hypothetical protein K432DRAFT_452318, partial [Lepidopterella palustris CBS 459.81]
MRKGLYSCPKVEGQPLWTIWDNSRERKEAYFIERLSGFVTNWKEIFAEYHESVGAGLWEDALFYHLLGIGSPIRSLGPYYSRKEYSKGPVDNPQNRRPNSTLTKKGQALAHTITSFTHEGTDFSHGDLHPGNIFVGSECTCTIAAILEWGASGSSISEQEFEAKSRAGHLIWVDFVELVLPSMLLEDYSALRDLEQALVLYSRHFGCTLGNINR